MPSYQYICENKHHFDRYLPVADYQTPQTCECGAGARRIISLPMLIISGPDVCYDSPIDGRPVTSMQARREDLARSGCTPYDPGRKEDYDRRGKEAEAALDKAVDETVDREIALMPTRKREKLEAELTAGASVEPIRLTAPAQPIIKDLHNG